MPAVQWLSVLEILMLVVWANAVPVVTRLILGARFARTIDGGVLLGDGRPLFGSAKTWRGLIGSLITTPIGAVVLGLPWTLGLGVAVAAMAGDLAASFVKRRLGLPPSSAVTGLDQVPESLFPALVAARTLGLNVIEIALVVLAFVCIDLWLTPWAGWLRVRIRGWR